ncbi:hypothetical protein VSR69_39315 [Paraburkholderia phytofirmans]
MATRKQSRRHAKTSHTKKLDLIAGSSEDVVFLLMARFILDQAPRHAVGLLISPSWEVGRIVKVALAEAAFQYETGFLQSDGKTSPKFKAVSTGESEIEGS